MNNLSSYYQNYSFKNIFSLFWKSITENNSSKKISLANRAKDYSKLFSNKDKLPLHAKLNDLISKSQMEWKSHDYGEGYFYQGLKSIGITGLRDSDARFESFNLQELIYKKELLEIGCNSGFLTTLMAPYAEKVTAFDINPFIVEMGIAVASSKGITNIDFQVTSFEKFVKTQTFDTILSFANHSTFDGNTVNNSDEFFLNCKNMLRPNGLLIFESHHPQYEDEQALEKTVNVMKKYFSIKARQIIKYGTFFDSGRTLILGEPLK